MPFLLLFVFYLLLSTIMAQNSTELDEDLKHLIQKPSGRNAIKKELKIDPDSSGLGMLEINHENPILILLWVFILYLVIASIIKMGYHQSNFFTTMVPESCLLIIIGVAFGTLIKINDFKNIPKFTVDLFFLGLMPPIILQSSFALHNEYFFENVITIIMYAVIGTLINEFLIGVSLYMFSIFDIEFLHFPRITLIELLIFANIISAVDPVTVLTIFQELKVNKPLYYLVFGESLLNDAVVIVVHSLLDNFIRAPIITSSAIINGFTSFFITSIGGFMIGVIFGLGTAFITLYTEHSLVIEPMIMIGMAYSSFLTADLISWSGLISLIGCGLVQYEFAWVNISNKTKVTYKYFITTLSSVSDLLIFFFLGQMLVNEEQDWNTSFILLTIIFCLIARTISVFGLTYISNNYFHRTRAINVEEQVLMAYGGLRGAVAFAMIALLEENKDIEYFRILKTTTFVLIFFTVFILGGTTKPLLNFLRIQKEAVDSKKLCFVLNDKVIDIVISGIEDVVGNPSATNYLKHKLEDLKKYLKKYLCKERKDKHDDQITKQISRPDIRKDDNFVTKEKTGFTDQKPSSHIEDFPQKTEKIAQKIYSNTEMFRNIVSKKLDRNIFITEEVHRKHTVPKDLSSKIVAANEHFKSSNRKLFALRSDMNATELTLRFKTAIPQTIDNDNKKKDQSIAQKLTDDKFSKKNTNQSNVT